MKTHQSTSFLKENKGSLKISRTENGAYHVVFRSPETGRNSFAYGSNFKRAYKKMIHLYHLKYAV